MKYPYKPDDDKSDDIIGCVLATLIAFCLAMALVAWWSS